MTPSWLFLAAALLFAPGAARAGEAPSLAAAVAAGKLPPLAQRLPDTPMTVPMAERIGTYGGDWHSALLGGDDQPWLMRIMTYENLMRWNPDWSGEIPDIAQSVDVNADATRFTFHLRRGMRWSDGQPFTADDVRFWHDDLLLDKRFTPTPAEPFINADGTPCGFEMADEATFTFVFKKPKGLFLQFLATARPQDGLAVRYPSHYLRQFHPRYNPDVGALVGAAGQQDWTGLLAAKADMFSNPDLPTLNAWVVTQGYGQGTATGVKASRNPYYWKVDPAGNQLPYIDTMSLDIISDPQVLVAKTLAGEIDLQDRNLAVPANKPVLADGRQRGGYEFFTETSTSPNVMVLMLNLTAKDPALRAIFGSLDFRAGLSMALDRQELLDTVWLGQGEVAQTAPRPDSAYYNKRLAEQFTQHDLLAANARLDKVLPRRGADGLRLGPDGSRFVFTVAYSAADPVFGDALQIVKRQWAQAGIAMEPTPLDRTLIGARHDRGDLEGVAWTRGGGAGQEVVLDPRWYFPANNDSYYWAPAWAAWYTGVDPARSLVKPEEPPASAKRQMELYNQLQATGDFDGQVRLMREVLDIAAEQFWTMGIAFDANGYGVKKTTMRNVPPSMPASWIYPTPGPANPETFFKAVPR